MCTIKLFNLLVDKTHDSTQLIKNIHMYSWKCKKTIVTIPHAFFQTISKPYEGIKCYKPLFQQDEIK